MICISLTEKNMEQMLWALQETARVADLAEIRLDYMEEVDLPRLLYNRPCPVIITHRPLREGGKFEGCESDRVRALIQAIDLGAEYVDIEHDAVHEIYDRKHTKLIVSYHNFQKTPEDLPHIHRRLSGSGADIVKLAVWARSLMDNLEVFRILRSTEVPTIAICMGELSLITRVLAPKFKAFLTFSTLGAGPISGPGQLPVQMMRDLYHVDHIDPNTRVYGLLAPTPGRSPLLYAFNHAFRAIHINAVYLPFQVQEHEVKACVQAFRAIDVHGYTVAPPYQETLLDALDHLDDTARDQGAVDTLVTRGRELHGYYTGIHDRLEQISIQFELWTGVPAPIHGIRAILAEVT
jgi:3-dehydroquinate dehydratase/shikimate dehydrogenase